jgi:hypothetical protein
MALARFSQTQDFTMTETIDTLHAPETTLNDVIRRWNDVLCIWRLCRTGKCVRSRACRGADARRCFHAHFTLLPDSLIAWLYELSDAQKEGLSYGQAVDRMRDTIAENALEDWQEAITYSEKLLKAGKLTWEDPPTY